MVLNEKRQGGDRLLENQSVVLKILYEKKNMTYAELRKTGVLLDDEFRLMIKMVGIENEDPDGRDKDIGLILYREKYKPKYISDSDWDRRIFSLSKQGEEHVEAINKTEREKKAAKKWERQKILIAALLGGVTVKIIDFVIGLIAKLLSPTNPTVP